MHDIKSMQFPMKRIAICTFRSAFQCITVPIPVAGTNAGTPGSRAIGMVLKLFDIRISVYIITRNQTVNPTSIRKHLWWVNPNELAGMPLPWLSDGRLKAPMAGIDAFNDDVQFLAQIGIRSIIAALELPLHRKIFENCGFHYFSLQIPDGFPPTIEQAERMLGFYDSCPLPLGVHCEGGIGRTGTLLAVLLLHRGLSPSSAIHSVKQAMPPALENASQVQFIHRFGRHIKSNG
jgi:atypical dual specificity phosphatase